LSANAEPVVRNNANNISVELGVSRSIHLPHASLADEGGYVVVPEAVTDGQRHELWLNRSTQISADYTATKARSVMKRAA
jgi:hypothetical protein